VIDTQTPDSPGWWMKRLFAKLAEQRADADTLDSYYRCENGIPITASKTTREAYRRLMQMSRTNFAELVVEAVRERMVPVGFRTGAEGDELGDKEAWRIWQANSLDADSAIVARTQLSMRDAFVIVGPVDDEIEAPLITPEDPREVVAVADPTRRRRTRAALKAFHDDVLGLDVAYLYLPGEVWRATRKPDTASDGTPKSPTWDDGDEWSFDQSIVEVPKKVVPVVRFANRCDLFGRATGEYESHLPLLDRINYSILSRLEIATLQAFRQRAVKNLPDTDENGDEIDYSDIFAADPGALWQLPEGAEMWESAQVDLGPIRQAIRDDVQDLAAVTRTPLFYLTPEAANGSAEGASLAREGLVFKTGDRIVQASESWEQVMSLAFMFAGDEERAKRADMETLWMSPERFSLAERYDAATKAAAAGVPWRSIMRDVLQLSPQQVDRMESERAAELLLAPEPQASATSG
jgi:hypothetical protein